MDRPQETDVLIVGGGPAGLSVASHLGDGISSVVVHQDREIGKPIRTSGGSWLTDAKALGLPSNLYTIIGKGRIFSGNEVAEIDLAGNPVIAFDVTALYRYLATLSDDKPCQKLTGTKFLSTTRQADGWFLSKLRSAGQGEWQIRSRYIVDASGWHMAVLSSLSLGQAPARTGVGYEIEYPIGNMDPDTAIIFFGADARAGYGWGLPAPGGMFRLGIGVLQPDTADNPRDRMNALLSSDRLARYGIEMPTPDHVNAGIIPSVPYDRRLVYGGVIRVGDSANMATPTLGEGIRLCIESGRHLGACLTRVLETGAAHHLKTYERMANRKYARNYRFGFLTNTRAAGYDEHDWDRTVRRIGRLDSDLLVQAFKSEFTPAMMARTVGKSLIRKIWPRQA